MSAANLKRRAEEKADQRMNKAFGLGPDQEVESFEEKRMRAAGRIQEELKDHAEQTVFRFDKRQSSLSDTDEIFRNKSPHSRVANLIDVAFIASHQKEIERKDPLIQLLRDSENLCDLFLSLIHSPLTFDPTSHLDVLEHLAEDTDTIEDENTDTVEGTEAVEGSEGTEGTEGVEGSDTVEGQGTDADKKKEPDKSGSISHYLRVWRAPKLAALKLLEEWKVKYPVDWIHINIKQETITALATDTISFIYVGATIASTASDRHRHDLESLTTGYSKLFHFLKLIEGLPDFHCATYNIIPLAIELKTHANFAAAPSNLWYLNSAVWTIERALIASVSRELGLNSAFGGKFIDWNISPDVRSAIHDTKSYRPSRPSPDSVQDLPTAGVLARKKELLDKHYWAAREYARSKQQIPIANHATASAIEEAGHLNLLDDGTSLMLSVGKDIPLRDAFEEGSWYNEVAGTSPRNWRLASDIASGRIGKWKRQKRIFRELDAVDITYLYGPFLDFWAVCICHWLVMVFYLFFIRSLYIIRPRVILCASDKVSTILRAQKPDLPDLVKALVIDLSVSVGDMISRIETCSTFKDWEWTDCTGGSFLSYWVGRIVVVDYVGFYSIMLIRFDSGYSAYRPEFQRVLFEMNVLLAIMLNVLTYYARKQTDWNGSKARAVAQQTEACLVSLGLRDLFEKKRQEFLFVQTRFQSLSARSRKEFKDDSAEFASRLLAFQLKGAAMSSIRRATLQKATTAMGLPYSQTREDQLQVLLESSESAVPPKMQFGDGNWIEWVVSRKEGCNLVESARALTADRTMYVKAAVTARAAIDWQKKKGSGPYPGFSSKKTPTDIFLWLCDINTFDFKRLAQSQGYMMVICKICKLQGIMDHDQTSHSCPGPDPGGQFGNAQPIREYDENFKMTRLLIPAQLLNSPFKGAIMSANFDVEIDCVESTILDKPEIVIATRADQRTGNHAFLRSQIFIKQAIEHNPHLIQDILFNTRTTDFLPKVYEEYAARSIFYREKKEGLVIAERDIRHLPVEGGPRPIYALDPLV